MKNKIRPHQLLPLPPPSEFDPGEEDPGYFYRNFASQFIEDMLKMTNKGLNIDKRAVESLRAQITTVLKDVSKKLNRNPVVRKYQEQRAVTLQKQHREKATQNIRVLGDFLVKYKAKDINHRTWVVNTQLIRLGKRKDIQDKWKIKELKGYQKIHALPFLDAVIEKRLVSESEIAKEGMKAFAKYRLELWNRPRMDSANQAVEVPPFNPGSAKQKQELFEMLKVEPLAKSKATGNASWGRDQIEELLLMSTDDQLRVLLQTLVDFSYSGIIQNNFLKSFDAYTIDGVLYGNVKLFGAKSFRLTSNSPNLLNMPSTSSIYAKPLKKCFTAPEGYLVWAIDYSALEERTLASLSKDMNKCSIFLEGLDGHCFNALGYYKEEIAKHIDLTGDLAVDTKVFKEAINQGNKELKGIRQKSKGVTFKLNYQGMADADKGGVITDEMYDSFHNTLYKGVGKFRDAMIADVKKNGYVHLGLGCRMYVDDIDKEYRTVFNAYAGQFWSILTLTAINEINHQIKEKGLEENIQVNATIYDSIYGYVKKDAESIKWLNETLVPIMEKDFIENQTIKNSADLCIGTSWASVEDTELSSNASIEEIEEILGGIDV